jgi:hypothetical protein
MRFTWVEAACVVAIAIAALQLQPNERTARLFTPPPVAIPALKAWLVADDRRAPPAVIARVADARRDSAR